MPSFKVVGMTCAHCERAVTDALREVDPGASVDIDLASGTVSTDRRADVTRLADAIRAEGYQAQPVAA